MYDLCMFIYHWVLCLKEKFRIITIYVLYELIILTIMHSRSGCGYFVLCCSVIDSQLICKDIGNYVGGVGDCVYVMCVVKVDVCW